MPLRRPVLFLGTLDRHSLLEVCKELAKLVVLPAHNRDPVLREHLADQSWRVGFLADSFGLLPNALREWREGQPRTMLPAVRAVLRDVEVPEAADLLSQQC